MDILFSMMETVLLIVLVDQTIMVKLVLLVWLHKDGMVLNVLKDVLMVVYGMLHLKLVYVLPVNSGMDLDVLFVLMVKHGMLTHKAVNVLFHQPGMV